MDRLPDHLLSNMLCRLVYPFTPAWLVQRMRSLGTAWNQAYLQTVADSNQPSRGGLVHLSFLFGTDQDQRRGCAGSGLSRADFFPAFNAAFGFNRSPKLVATSAGFLCILLSNPPRLVVWNPVVNERINIPLPAGLPNDFQVGLHVQILDGLGHSPRTTVVIVYHNEQAFVLPGGMVGVWQWNSVDQFWIHAPLNVIFGAYRAGNVITHGDGIYFLVSDHSMFVSFPGVVHLNELLDVPLHVNRCCLCTYRGVLGVCTLHLGTIRIWTNALFDWEHTFTVNLLPFVRGFSPEFAFNPHHLRTRIPDDAITAVSNDEATLVAVSDEWVFLHQRGRLVRINLLQNNARRLYYA